MLKIRTLAVFLFVVCGAIAASVRAQEETFDLGLRAGGLLASGRPANDMLGYGVFGHYRINDRWRLGFALDTSEFDFERTASVVGLEQSPAVKDIDRVVLTWDGAPSAEMFGYHIYRDADKRLPDTSRQFRGFFWVNQTTFSDGFVVPSIAYYQLVGISCEGDLVGAY